MGIFDRLFGKKKVEEEVLTLEQKEEALITSAVRHCKKLVRLNGELDTHFKRIFRRGVKSHEKNEREGKLHSTIHKMQGELSGLNSLESRIIKLANKTEKDLTEKIEERKAQTSSRDTYTQGMIKKSEAQLALISSAKSVKTHITPIIDRLNSLSGKHFVRVYEHGEDSDYRELASSIHSLLQEINGLHDMMWAIYKHITLYKGIYDAEAHYAKNA